MARRILSIAGTLALIAVFNIIWQIYPARYGAPLQRGGLTQVYVGTPPAGAHKTVSVLFIGNSYTFAEDMPATLAQIAAHDPQGDTELRVRATTRPGEQLAGHWARGEAQKLIGQGHWDYVVLQEYSLWAMVPGAQDVSRRYFTKFDEQVRNAGAKSVLFLTWARQAGSPWYTDPHYSFLRDSHYMQAMFTSQTHALAATFGAQVAQVGEYWKLALAQNPALPLYAADGNHPSPAGAYLNALIFYKLFTGHLPEQADWTPPGVTEAQAAILRGIALLPLPAPELP